MLYDVLGGHIISHTAVLQRCRTPEQLLLYRAVNGRSWQIFLF